MAAYRGFSEGWKSRVLKSALGGSREATCNFPDATCPESMGPACSEGSKSTDEQSGLYTMTRTKHSEIQTTKVICL